MIVIWVGYESSNAVGNTFATSPAKTPGCSTAIIFRTAAPWRHAGQVITTSIFESYHNALRWVADDLFPIKLKEQKTVCGGRGEYRQAAGGSAPNVICECGCAPTRERILEAPQLL